jgi:hypothetical protein
MAKNVLEGFRCYAGGAQHLATGRVALGALGTNRDTF